MIKKYNKLLIHVLVLYLCGVLSKAEVITSSNCTITDPNLNYTFDFTSLHSELGHLFHYNNLTYKINVCKSDIKCSSYNDTVAACETNNSTSEVVLGYKSTLKWEDGGLSFEFIGEQCTEAEKYTLKTILLCTYKPMKVSEPLRINPKQNSDKCKNYAYWETEAACLPKYSKRDLCITKGKNGKDINLNELYEMNHKIADDDGKSYYYINFCDPVLYGIRTTCPLDTSICFVDGNETDPKKKYKNYGSLKSFAYENNQYVLRYESTEKCKNAPDKFIRTKITLECHHEDTEPVFYGVTNDCEAIFTMGTSLVCEAERPCFTYDPIIGKPFDLSSLTNKTYDVKHNESKIIYGICSPPLSPCNATDGTCQISKETRQKGYGQYSTELHLNGTDNHMTYLEYLNGDVCTNDTKWRTQIVFHCDETGKEKSKVIEESNCTLVISHPTKLMCNKGISCTLQKDDGTTVDLTHLKQHQGNFLAEIDPKLTNYKKYKFYLHVCRPLYLQPGLNCPGSSACRTVTVNGKEEEETSLGYPDVSLTLDDDGLPVLKYFKGGVCEKDNKTDLSSEIRFMCDPKQGTSLPVLKEVKDDCQYIFEWATNKICDPKEVTYIQESCSLENADLKSNVSLKDIFKSDTIPIKYQSGSININLCNKINDTEQILAQYKDDTVIFKFKAKEHKCNNKTDKYLTVVMELECGPKMNQSSIANADDCYLQLKMTTPLICPILGVKLSSNASDIVTTTTTTSTTVIPPKNDETVHKGGSHVTLTIMLLLACFIGLGTGTFYIIKSPVRRHRVLGLFRRNTGSVLYTRVNDDTDTSLLTVRTRNVGDSDDDLII